MVYIAWKKGKHRGTVDNKFHVILNSPPNTFFLSCLIEVSAFDIPSILKV